MSRIESIVHLAKMQEKVKRDSLLLKEAQEWLEAAAYIDNVPADATVTFTVEERSLLEDAYHILWKKRNDAKAYLNKNYDDLRRAMKG